MNTSLIRLLVVFAWLTAFGQGAFAAVVFTVTPVAVSNTYPGTISLAITGLTNTETVVIQKFIDLNTNGVIDGGDILMQQFTLQDGTNFAIGGVTNFNVPGDTNTTAGQITATLNFQGGDFMQNVVGKYLYKLSSPGGHFTPLTNQFAVTNFPFLQKFTGTTTVSNAVVVLFPPPRLGHNGPGGTPLAGVVANNAGGYTIQAPPGTYVPVAFRSNYVANYTAPLLTLGSGVTITTNLTLTIATTSISGTNVDANNSSIGLPGVGVPVMSTNGLMTIAFTDTNGNFNARVTAGNWGLQADDTFLIVHGYLGLQNGTGVTAPASGVTLAVPKATALIYGSVRDNLGNPLAGLDVYADDNPGSGLYQTDGNTDANGNYVLGVLGSVTDSWWVQANGNNQLTNYVFSQQNTSGSIISNQVVLQNFTGILATNHITGNVKVNGTTNIAGVAVWASATINSTNFYQNVDTDTNGNYWLNVPNGSWTVGVECYGGSDSLDNILGNGNYACPNNQSVTISGNNTTNNFNVQLCGGISISTTSPLPVGELGVYYSQQLQASSCNGSFTWSFFSGSLPGNVLLSTPGGELSGTPASIGVFTFTAQVTDGASLTTNKLLSMTISNAVEVTTTTLPNGTNGLNYSQQLLATAGVPFSSASPYSWSLASGSLPANLTLATNGLLSGTLAADSGTFDFTVEVADSLGGIYNQPLSLDIVTTNLPPLTVGTSTSTNGEQIIVLWPASAGTNFTVQMTTNLLTGPWVPATNGVPSIAYTFTNNLPAAFFRLQ
jgi:hypothetical protein